MSDTQVSDAVDSVATGLYEVDGAIRGCTTDLILGLANHAHERQREQTAATILAALIQGSDQADVISEKGRANWTRAAVEIADALRAELAKGRP